MGLDLNTSQILLLIYEPDQSNFVYLKDTQKMPELQTGIFAQNLQLTIKKLIDGVFDTPRLSERTDLCLEVFEENGWPELWSEKWAVSLERSGNQNPLYCTLHYTHTLYIHIYTCEKLNKA